MFFLIIVVITRSKALKSTLIVIKKTVPAKIKITTNINLEKIILIIEPMLIFSPGLRNL